MRAMGHQLQTFYNRSIAWTRYNKDVVGRNMFNLGQWIENPKHKNKLLKWTGNIIFVVICFKDLQHYILCWNSNN